VRVITAACESVNVWCLNHFTAPNYEDVIEGFERVLSRACYKVGGLNARRSRCDAPYLFAGVRGDMILLTTSWKLIFAPAQKGETRARAQDQSAEGGHETGAEPDCTTAARDEYDEYDEREPRASSKPDSERSSQRRSAPTAPRR
jgi:hypothetical protein